MYHFTMWTLIFKKNIDLVFPYSFVGKRDSYAKSAPAFPDHAKLARGVDMELVSCASVILLHSCLELERRGLSVAIQ